MAGRNNKDYYHNFDNLNSGKEQTSFLRLTSSFVNNFLDILPVPIIIINDQQVITFINQTATDLFTLPKNKIIGKLITNHFIAEERGILTEYINSLFSSKPRSRSFSRQKGKSLQTIEFSPTNQILTDSQILINLQDVSVRKHILEELIESEKRYHELFNLLPDVVYSLSAPEGKFTALNPAFEKITGWKAEEVLGKSFNDFIHPDDLEITINAFKIGLKEKKLQKFQTRFRTKSGNYLLGDFRSAPKIVDGRVVGKFGVARDITEQKRIKDQLIEREQHRELLFGGVSHELKNLLTSAKAYLQILKRKLNSTSDAEALDYINKIDSRLNGLNVLMVDFIDLIRIRSGRLILKKRKTNLKQLLVTLINDLQGISPHHLINLSAKKIKNINLDQERIKQVLINLLDNALKYSPNAKEVKISLSQKDSHVIISIQDFGIGISKNDQINLFEPFFRANLVKKGGLAGIGLGLFISSEIVKLHEGKIIVKSQRGQGSTFTILLPIS